MMRGRAPPPPTHIRQCWPPPCIDKGREYYLMAPMFRDVLPPPPQLRNQRDPLRTSHSAPCHCSRNNRSRSVEDQGRVRWQQANSPSPELDFSFNLGGNKENLFRRKSVEDLLQGEDVRDARKSRPGRFPPPRRRVSYLFCNLGNFKQVFEKLP
ncbi:Hypothetical predicted protein [Cloeon dipterum]|uniref:Uncharacterized protein n=1 Tax=Cloeon dipterum TaxID=197152 RepID=A0A8S1CDE1_9INSE|nr:Hypothetical predicted protein [Cloeon dipterum]